MTDRPRLRVTLDATPLLGRRTGIGRYVAGLAAGLATLPEAPEVTLAAFTARGARSVPRLGGARVAGRPFPARALQWAWARSEFPPAEWLTGACDVLHATNYVLPPTRHARGVVSVHDLTYVTHADTVTPAVARYRVLVPRSIRRAAYVLTLSEALAGEVAEHYRLPRDRVRVARPGVDDGWAQATPPDTALRGRLGLPEHYLLFVGSIEPRKNLPMLLRALRAARAEDPTLPPLVLAGPAGWGPPLDLGALAPDAVVRLGFLDDADLRRVVAGARALLFPSRYEGFGLPPLEALATGTAVVSSDLPVLREVTGSHATYVAADDQDAWAGALLALTRPDDDRSRAARRAHAAPWTWTRCAHEAAATYAAALGS